MGQCFLTVNTMKIFVFLTLLSLVYSAPAPQDETLEVEPYIHEEIEALPYEHDPTGDVAEAYVHEEIEALPYLHEETPEEEPEPAALVIPQPVVPYYAALPKEEGEKKVALISPFHLVAGYKTGCLNSLGSLVPCHLQQPPPPPLPSSWHYIRQTESL